VTLFATMMLLGHCHHNSSWVQYTLLRWTYATTMLFYAFPGVSEVTAFFTAVRIPVYPSPYNHETLGHTFALPM